MTFRRRAVLAFASALVLITAAHAETWPSKPIRMIVPFPPGGGTDLITRELTNKIAASGITFIVDNKPGSGGNLGIDAAAKARPDGYTLVMGQTSNLAINPTLYARLPYDPQKDLTPVSLVATSPLVIVASAESPFKAVPVMQPGSWQPGLSLRSIALPALRSRPRKPLSSS